MTRKYSKNPNDDPYRPRNHRFRFIDNTQEINDNFVVPAQNNKRARLKLTPEQTNTLEESFMNDQKPSQITKERLAALLEIPVKNVKVWFQNRRAKAKNNYERTKIYNNEEYEEYQMPEEPIGKFENESDPTEDFMFNPENNLLPMRRGENLQFIRPFSFEAYENMPSLEAKDYKDINDQLFQHSDSFRN